MKQACFYTKNNLHELEQSDLPTRRDEGMLVLPTQKKSLLKKWHYIFAFCLAMAFSSSLFAINLTVSGITESPYTDANGVYISQGTLNGAEYWKHQTKNYYIYYAPYSGGGVYWNLDVDTEDENDKPDEAGTIAGSTSSEVSTDPPIGISWVSGSSGFHYSFSITIAEYSTVPEIDISGNGNSIISGDNTPSFADYTKFASTDVSGETSTRMYTIYNTGTVDALTVGTITIGGTNAADFTVTTSPGSPVSQSSSTTFTITFNPSASGERTATVSIANNDSNENPYTFTISGYGYTSKNLVVSGINSTYAEANGIYIHQGVLNGFQYWKHSTLNYYIYYSLTFRYWIIDSNQNSGNDWLFSSFSELYSPSGLTYDPSLGAGPVAVNEEVAVPNINIKVGAYTISNGSATTLYYNNTNFGSLEVTSGESTKSYTIENIGNATLTLSGASPYFTITGTNASDFSVATTPSNSISASGTTTFGITFNPSAAGTRTATVTVLSNDADKPTYTFAIQGEGVNPRNLVVSNITAPSAANGTYIYQGILNEFQYWKHQTESYYIFSSKLYGTSPVWYINSDLSADINTPLSYNFYSHTDYVSPVSVSSWTSASGSIGTPLIQYTEPEINITGNSANIISGDASPSLYDYTDLGWVVSGSISKTFTIQNTGISTLNLTGTSPYITFSGADASQFSITSAPSATIAPGGSTTFGVTFTPSSGTLGARTATLSILNDDTNENPYTFLVQSGVGTLPIVTTQDVSGIGTTTAIGNGNVTSLGSPNPTSYGICYGATVNPDVTGSKVDKGTASVTGAFPAELSGLTLATTYHARAFATNNVGTVYGDDVTFTTQNTVSSIVLASSSPTNASSVSWTVTFAVPLTGLTTTNFSLANTGLTSPSISTVTGSGTTWTVTANTGSGSGTLGLNMANSSDLSTKLSNPTFTGEVYTIDKTAPTVSSINRQDPADASTTATSVIFRVTFSEPVNGVDASDFTLTTTGASTGSIASVSAATGTTIDVTVNSISGYGTIRLNLKASGTGITDALANAISSGFASGETYTTLTSGTFTGTSGTDWATAGNWAGNAIPGSSIDVIIPTGKTAIIGATTSADCNNLTVTGNLTIQSSASGTGSLIVSGTSSGTVSAERYMTGGAWYVVSPIAAFGSISTFIQAPENAIPSKNGSYGMMDYNETTNTWNTYYAATTPDILPAGKGYSMRRTSDGIVTFTGDLTSGTKLVSLSMNGMGWNCIGNPYTSAINMNDEANATNNFLKTNSYILDGSYACMYVWDDATLSYKILGNVSYGTRDLLQNILQAGQGFFVKAASDGVLVQFTQAMQVHSTTTNLKSAETSWPGFELTATNIQTKASTMVAFNNSMTKGLDPTYDAGLLRGTSGVSLYTRLVDDNGVDFAIQCLPEDGMENFVVPVGLDTKAGGEVKFSATTTGLPTGSSVILEDRTAKVYTDLSNGEEYAVTLSANSSGTGRFYIHTSNLTTRTSELLPTGGFSLKAYPANEVIWIEGEVSSSAKAYLFSIGGSKLGEFNLQEGNRNSIPASGLATGVYLLKVTDGSKQFNTKVVIYE